MKAFVIVDTIVFPEYYLFSSTHLKENIISLLIVVGILILFGLIVEAMMKRIFKKMKRSICGFIKYS
ncbi:Uncharacterized protein BCRIVMBC938_01055 [Bacillus wiedmannii]|nr:Uncharacterized protein BCRIVMBC938_01055 [Bacillus wiedmannii]